MNKQGFTLIELLAALFIIGVVILVIGGLVWGN